MDLVRATRVGGGQKEAKVERDQKHNKRGTLTCTGITDYILRGFPNKYTISGVMWV